MADSFDLSRSSFHRGNPGGAIPPSPLIPLPTEYRNGSFAGAAAGTPVSTVYSSAFPPTPSTATNVGPSGPQPPHPNLAQSQMASSMYQNQFMESMTQRDTHLMREVAELQHEVKTVRLQLAQEANRVHENANMYHTEKSRNDELQMELNQCRTEMRELQDRIADSQRTLNVKDDELNTRRMDHDELVRMVEDLEDENQHQKVKIQELEMQLRLSSEYSKVRDHECEEMVHMNDNLAGALSKIRGEFISRELLERLVKDFSSQLKDMKRSTGEKLDSIDTDRLHAELSSPSKGLRSDEVLEFERQRERQKKLHSQEIERLNDLHKAEMDGLRKNLLEKQHFDSEVKTDLEKRILLLQRDLQDSEDSHHQERKKLIQDHQQDVRRLEREVEELTNALKKTKSDAETVDKSSREEQKRLKKKMEVTEATQHETAKQSQKIELDLQSAKNELEATRTELEEVARHRSQLEDELNSRERFHANEKEDWERSVRELNMELRELKQELSTAIKSSKDEVDKNEKSFVKSKKKRDETIKKLRAELDELRTSKEDELSQLFQELEVLKKESAAEHDTISLEMQMLREKVKFLTSEKESLQERLKEKDAELEDAHVTAHSLVRTAVSESMRASPPLGVRSPSPIMQALEEGIRPDVLASYEERIQSQEDTIVKLKRDLMDVESEAAELRDDVRLKADLIALLKDEKSSLEEERVQLTARVHEAMGGTLADINGDLRTVRDPFDRMEGRTKEMEHKFQRLEVQFLEKQQEVKERQKEIVEINREKHRIEKDLESAKMRVEQESNRVKNTELRVLQLETDVREKQRLIAEYEDILREATGKHEFEVSNLRSHMRETLTGEKQTSQDLRVELAKATTHLQYHKDELKRNQERIQELEADQDKYAILRGEHGALKQCVADMESHHQQELKQRKRQAVSELEHELVRIKESYDRMHEDYTELQGRLQTSLEGNAHVGQLEKKVNRYKKLVEDDAVVKTQLRTDVDHLRAELEEERNRCRTLRRDVDVLSATKSEFRSECETLRAQLSGATAGREEEYQVERRHLFERVIDELDRHFKRLHEELRAVSSSDSNRTDLQEVQRHKFEIRKSFDEKLNRILEELEGEWQSYLQRKYALQKPSGDESPVRSSGKTPEEQRLFSSFETTVHRLKGELGLICDLAESTMHTAVAQERGDVRRLQAESDTLRGRVAKKQTELEDVEKARDAREKSLRSHEEQDRVVCVKLRHLGEKLASMIELVDAVGDGRLEDNSDPRVESEEYTELLRDLERAMTGDSITSAVRTCVDLIVGLVDDLLKRVSIVQKVSRERDDWKELAVGDARKKAAKKPIIGANKKSKKDRAPQPYSVLEACEKVERYMKAKRPQARERRNLLSHVKGLDKLTLPRAIGVIKDCCNLVDVDEVSALVPRMTRVSHVLDGVRELEGCVSELYQAMATSTSNAVGEAPAGVRRNTDVDDKLSSPFFSEAVSLLKKRLRERLAEIDADTGFKTRLIEKLKSHNVLGGSDHRVHDLSDNTILAIVQRLIHTAHLYDHGITSETQMTHADSVKAVEYYCKVFRVSPTPVRRLMEHIGSTHDRLESLSEFEVLIKARLGLDTTPNRSTVHDCLRGLETYRRHYRASTLSDEEIEYLLSLKTSVKTLEKVRQLLRVKEVQEIVPRIQEISSRRSYTTAL